MESEKQLEEFKDRDLWNIAKKRVGFKRHLGSYIIVNTMLWLIWCFSGKNHQGDFPWPLWPMLGWGIGLAFSYLDAYVYNKGNAIDKEYEKLKNNK